MKGSAFFEKFKGAPMGAWEQAALDLVMSGENFAWPMVPVPLDALGHVTVNVASDYFGIGEGPDDFFYLPLTPLTAQKIADALGLVLPTTKIVRDTWRHAGVAGLQVEPEPMRPFWSAHGLNPDARMVTIEGYNDHNVALQAALANRGSSDLVSGTLKDVVISNRIRPDAPGRQGSVAIYGWFDKDGKFVDKGQPIQGLNPSDHVNTYADYSHGIRFLDPIASRDGQPISLFDPAIAALVTDEGSIQVRRYDTGAAPPLVSPAAVAQNTTPAPVGPLAAAVTPAAFTPDAPAIPASLLGTSATPRSFRTPLLVGGSLLALVALAGLTVTTPKKKK